MPTLRSLKTLTLPIQLSFPTETSLKVVAWLLLWTCEPVIPRRRRCRQQHWLVPSSWDHVYIVVRRQFQNINGRDIKSARPGDIYYQLRYRSFLNCNTVGLLMMREPVISALPQLELYLQVWCEVYICSIYIQGCCTVRHVGLTAKRRRPTGVVEFPMAVPPPRCLGASGSVGTDKNGNNVSLTKRAGDCCIACVLAIPVCCYTGQARAVTNKGGCCDAEGSGQATISVNIVGRCGSMELPKAPLLLRLRRR